MIKMNKGGLFLTGLGAYLILSKGISAVRGAVRDIADASKWKAYYKSKMENAVPPGYSVKTSTSSSSSEPEEEDNKGQNKGSEDSLSSVISKEFDTILNGVKREKDPLEGQTEASKDENKAEPEEESVNDHWEPSEPIDDVVDNVIYPWEPIKSNSEETDASETSSDNEEVDDE